MTLRQKSRMAVINITLILNCILQIISVCIGNFSMRKVTKILIIPLMLASFFIDMAYIGGYELKPVLYAGLPVFMGLIFGWLGDIFLLKDTGFVKGLACFLLGHIFYIIHFARNSGINENPVYLFVLIPYAVYFIIILKKLMPVVDHKMAPGAMLHVCDYYNGSIIFLPEKSDDGYIISLHHGFASSSYFCRIRIHAIYYF